MAEAKNKGKPDAEQDQSMEEILQSIRRIIAEEGDESESVKATYDEQATDMPKGSNILELTDIVRDDGSVENIEAKTETVQNNSDVLASIDHVLTNSEPGEGLLSQENVFAAAAALKPMMAVQSKAPTAAVSKAPSMPFRSGATVEDLVMESLQPMLKNWLDSNLKTIVEQLVQKEIKRIVAMNSD